MLLSKKLTVLFTYSVKHSISELNWLLEHCYSEKGSVKAMDSLCEKRNDFDILKVAALLVQSAGVPPRFCVNERCTCFLFCRSATERIRKLQAWIFYDIKARESCQTRTGMTVSDLLNMKSYSQFFAVPHCIYLDYFHILDYIFFFFSDYFAGHSTNAKSQL